MKRIHLATLIITTITCFGLLPRAQGQFYFPVGIAYCSGVQNASDKLLDYYQQDGYTTESRIIIPVGLVLNPYYDWQTPIGAIGAGVSVGPTAFNIVDNVSMGHTSFSYAVPVGGFMRYTPWPKATFSPYVRVGVEYPFAGGDNFESSSVGVVGAVGIELWRTKMVGVSLEAGYDTSQIKVKYTSTLGGGGLNIGQTYSSKVDFPAFTASLSVVF